MVFMLGQRLLNIRRKRGMTQTELAAAMGDRYGHSAISQAETGKQGLRLDGLARAAEALNVSTDYLLGLTDEEEAFGATFLPIYPEVVRAGEHNTQGNIIAPRLKGPFAFNRERLELDGIDPEQAKVYQVVGDSMAPTLPDGSAIVVDYLRTTPRPNCLFVIYVEGNSLLVKRAVMRGRERWWGCDNPDYAPIPDSDAVKVWGQVRWSMRRFDDDGR